MIKGEIEILTAIVLNKGTAKQITSSRIARSSSYINSTIHSLVEQGYIVKNRYHGYQITQKGTRAFMEYSPNREALERVAHSKVAHEHTNKAEEAIRMIENLGIEYFMKMEDFQN